MPENQRARKASRPKAGRGRRRKSGAEAKQSLVQRTPQSGALTPVVREHHGEPVPSGEHAGRPLWVPEGVDLEVLPDEVRRAVADVVEPVYERFVLGADDPLEKSLGVTVAHLVWLEVLQQFDMKRHYTKVSAVLGLAEDRQGVIDQHLRIIGSKVKVGYLLARLREFRRHQPGGPLGGVDAEPRILPGESVPEHGRQYHPVAGPEVENLTVADQNEASGLGMGPPPATSRRKRPLT
jgi:hypothetical protein